MKILDATLTTMTFIIVILIALSFQKLESQNQELNARVLDIEQMKYQLQLDEFKFRANFLHDEVESYKNDYFEHNLSKEKE